MSSTQSAIQGVQPLDEFPPREAWQIEYVLQASTGASPTSAGARGTCGEQHVSTSTQSVGGEAECSNSTAQGLAHALQGATEASKPEGDETPSQLAAAPEAAPANAGPSSVASGTQQQVATVQAPLAAQQQPMRRFEPQVLRSSQLDAGRLDLELTAMLREQLMRIFSLFPPGRVADFEPEINATLMLLVYGLSVWQGKATPGSQLLNLRYRNERAAPPGGKFGVDGPPLSSTQRALLCAGYVVVPYLWSRLNRAALGSGGAEEEDDFWGGHGGFGDDYTTTPAPAPAKDGAAGGSSTGVLGAVKRLGGTLSTALLAWLRKTSTQKAMRSVESAYKAAAVLNFLLFLRQGRYRSLLERCVGARLVHSQASMARVVSFEYLNRQLVWQELSEFLLFVLPLVNVTKIKRWVGTVLLPRLPSPAALLGSSGDNAAAGAGDGAGGATATAGGAATAADAACPLCGTREVLVPLQALPCRHVFCYYCLRANCAADKQFLCPVDGVRVTAMRRCTGRVGAQKQQQ